MILSKNKYPILARLTDPPSLASFDEPGLVANIARIYTYEEIDIIINFTTDLCKSVIESEMIDYVSPSFYDKATEPNVFKSLAGVLKKVTPCSGLFLLPPGFGEINAVTYKIGPDNLTGELGGIVGLYTTHGRVALVIFFFKGDKIEWKYILSDNAKATQEETKDNIFRLLIGTMAIITFKQFAEIETIHIGGREYPKKIKIGRLRYMNKHEEQINILDSRWFTETVRTEGFGVSGHFRLQPYGPGLSKKKLIYIDDYLKHGYTRKARKRSSINN